mmetsp:Transcript_145075/g.361880  ORF Transcript_145075/g.361880 Transcript_145075/m.361880 type:complete len:80 (+) Transcript_145075:1470-1709(+)
MRDTSSIVRVDVAVDAGVKVRVMVEISAAVDVVVEVAIVATAVIVAVSEVETVEVDVYTVLGSTLLVVLADVKEDVIVE